MGGLMGEQQSSLCCRWVGGMSGWVGGWNGLLTVYLSTHTPYTVKLMKEEGLVAST